MKSFIKLYLHEGHDHGGHNHENDTAAPEERLALLKYMLQHNAHHAEELHDLAHGVEGDAYEYIHEAVLYIEDSNVMLKKAIKCLENK